MIKHKLSPAKAKLSKINSHRAKLNKPGVFVLYRTNLGSPAFVGRSDTSVFSSLLKLSEEGRYHYYKFMPCGNEEDAYKWECIYWHSGVATIDNKHRHPQKLRGTKVSCPYPGCDHDAYAEELSHDPESSYEEHGYGEEISEYEPGTSPVLEHTESSTLSQIEETKEDSEFPPTH